MDRPNQDGEVDPQEGRYMKTQRTFGQYFRELRVSKKMTLRKFCEENGFDPGNISRLERDVFQAPESSEKLEEYARALGVERGTADWLTFFDLATVSNRSLGTQQISNEALLRKLPVLFRTLNNKELTDEKLDQIIELIKKS